MYSSNSLTLVWLLFRCLCRWYWCRSCCCCCCCHCYCFFPPLCFVLFYYFVFVSFRFVVYIHFKLMNTISLVRWLWNANIWIFFTPFGLAFAFLHRSVYSSDYQSWLIKNPFHIYQNSFIFSSRREQKKTSEHIRKKLQVQQIKWKLKTIRKICTKSRE